MSTSTVFSSPYANAGFHRDRTTLDDILDHLRESIQFLNKDIQDREHRIEQDWKFSALRNMLYAALLNHRADGTPLQESASYQYSDFTVSTGHKNPLTGRRRENYLSLLVNYLKDMKKKSHDGFNGEHLRMLQDIEQRIEGIPDVRNSAKAIRQKDSIPNVIQPLPRYGVWENTKATVLQQPNRKSSFWTSTATSILLGGVSRYAVMAALGTTGTPVFAAMLAGSVIAGGVTAYYKNRGLIGKEVAQAREEGAGFWGRLGARWTSFRRFYTWKHLALNTGGALLGMEVGSIAHDVINASPASMSEFGKEFMRVAGDRVQMRVDQGIQLAFEASDTIRDIDLSGVSTAAASVYDSGANSVVAVRHWLDDMNVMDADQPFVTAQLPDASMETTGGIIDHKVEPVVADTTARDTVDMVQHRNISEVKVADAVDTISRENFYDRMGTTSETAQLLEASQPLTHAFSAQTGNTVENALNEFAAGKTPSVADIIGYETYVVPEGVTRYSEFVNAYYGLEPGSEEAYKALNAVIQFNHIDDVTVVDYNTDLKLPLDYSNPGEQAVLVKATYDVSASVENINRGVMLDADAKVSEIKVAAPVEEVAPVPVAMTQYTIKRGDNMWELAEKLYGVSSRDAAGHHEFIREMAAANPDILKNPNNLKVGQVLNVPTPGDDNQEAVCRVVRGRVKSCLAPNVG